MVGKSIKAPLAASSACARTVAFRLICGLAWHIFCVGLLAAQQLENDAAPTIASPAAVELPQGFDRFRFGMSSDMVEALIAESLYLNANLEDAISVLPRSTIRVLSVNGDSYVSNAHFQFDESGLISIILNLNNTLLDHFALYSYLIARYGEADSLHPRRIEWRSPTVILRLERPLTVKYVARRSLEERQEAAAANLSEAERYREAFIELF